LSGLRKAICRSEIVGDALSFGFFIKYRGWNLELTRLGSRASSSAFGGWQQLARD
jgi:hypothetical protein